MNLIYCRCLDLLYNERNKCRSAYTQGTPNLASGDGAVSFNIGATLSTSSNASSVDYPDGEYSGSFNIEVSY
ncbi:DUF4402 domain-containing protein [Pseudoalteromonas sp. B193]